MDSKGADGRKKPGGEPELEENVQRHKKLPKAIVADVKKPSKQRHTFFKNIGTHQLDGGSYSLTNSIWKDRTQACFRNQLQTTPLRISLDLARVEIEASFHGKSSNGRWQKGVTMLEEINQIIEIADRPAQRPAEETLNRTESSEANEQASELADRLALLSTEGPSNRNENSQSNENTSDVPTRNPP
ncbi:hypothetical protein R1flu_028790 [Riccia fluitans]|uniref:Uncharacterized protein n=1 Tax=Riccia fluitans TaxID=41844 RepID=A0ABD1XMP8_9MARC